MRVIQRALHMGAIWMLLSVCLWAVGTACISSVIPASSGVSRYSMRFAPQSLPSFEGIAQYYDKQASRAEKAAIPGMVTAWAEERNRQLSATEWMATAAVDIYYMNGNVMDVMNLMLLAGGFPVHTDKTGISIDVKTAVKLFGSSTPIGLEINMNGQKYTVRGIFDCPRGLVAVGGVTGRGLAVLSPPSVVSTGTPEGKASNTIGVQGVEFIFPAGLSPDEAKSYAIQLAAGMGLHGAAFSKDYSAEDTILRQIAQLPGWVMMAVAIMLLLFTAYSQTRMMLRVAWRRMRSRDTSENIAFYTLLRGILWGIVILFTSICIFLVVRPEFSLPPSYIPTQWSDLDFWPELIRKKMMNQTERNALPVALPDAIKRSLTVLGIAFIAASLSSIYFFNACLYKVLGHPVATRLRRHPDEGFHAVARWDTSSYLLLLFSAAAPIVGFKLTALLGLKPVISGTTLTMLVIPAMMVSTELILRLWPSALWPLRFSPMEKLIWITRRISNANILSKNIEEKNKRGQSICQKE